MNTCLYFLFDGKHPKTQTYCRLRFVLDRLGKQTHLTGKLRVGWDGGSRLVLATTGKAGQTPMQIL